MIDLGLRPQGRFDTTFDVFALRWTLGDFVRKLREERGWTQQDLANKAGVHKTAIVRLERQSDKSERVTVEKAAQALKVSALDLYAHAEHARVFSELDEVQRARIAAVARQYAERNAAAANRPPSEESATANQRAIAESATRAKIRRAR